MHSVWKLLPQVWQLISHPLIIESHLEQFNICYKIEVWTSLIIVLLFKLVVREPVIRYVINPSIPWAQLFSGHPLIYT